MVWIDLLPLIFGGLATLLTLVGSVAVSIRWAMRRETAPVIEKIDAVADRLDVWIKEHQRRHEDEKSAIAAAFEREGMHGPDGWARGPRRPYEDHE